MKFPWPIPFGLCFAYSYGHISGASQLEEELLLNKSVLLSRILGQSVNRIADIYGNISTAHPLSQNYQPVNANLFKEADAQFDAIIQKYKIREMVEKHIASLEQ